MPPVSSITNLNTMNKHPTRPQWLDYHTWKTPRWKTSIYRKDLSAPTQILLKHRLVNTNNSVLDFGCGRAAYDAVNLTKRGFEQVSYFDPYYYANFDLLNHKYDTVLLNFVINVIESEQERQEVLQYCWNLCRLHLLISVRTGRKGEMYTGAGTFQKYYTHLDFTEFLSKLYPVYDYWIKGGVGIIFKR